MSSSRPCLRLLASALSLAVLAGMACGTTTRLSNVWRSESYSAGPMHKVLVVGIAQTSTGRRSFEDRFVEALASQQVDAVQSYRLLPSDERLSEATLKEAIRGHGFDGVIATRLIEVDEETTYVPPSTTVTTTIVRLETHLYDAEQAELVWSAQSDTFDPDSTQDAIDSVTKKIAKQLASEDLLPR